MIFPVQVIINQGLWPSYNVQSSICNITPVISIHLITTYILFPLVSDAHAWSLSFNMDVNLAGDGPVFGSPCGCDITEKSATAILRFTSDSTHHKPREERVESHTAQANIVWPGTFLTRNKRLARNASRCRVWPFIVLGRFVEIGLCRAVATLVSANFQINISAIPYWKLVWMDSFFLQSSPYEGQSEERTDWGYRRQSCWMCVYSKWTFVFIVVVPISPVGCLVSGSLTLAINRVFVPHGAGRAVRCLIAPHFPG